jgi:hypothetical protein
MLLEYQHHLRVFDPGHWLVADQAVLHGLLSKVRDLSLELLVHGS